MTNQDTTADGAVTVAVSGEGTAAAVPHKGRIRRLAERGLTTVEYALGLLAAATVALMLLRIFADNRFFEMLWDWVVRAFDLLVAG